MRGPGLGEVASAYLLTGFLAEIGREALGSGIVDHEVGAGRAHAMYFDRVDIAQIEGGQYLLGVLSTAG